LRSSGNRHLGIELERGKRPRLSRELLARLLEMVRVQMRIAKRMHEIADAQPADLRDHVREQRIAGDVERNAEEDVAAALVQLATEPTIDHVELEHRVARHQGHLRQLGDVPGRHDQPARVRVALDLLHHPADLVDLAAVAAGPVPPLLAVDRAELAVFVGPLVPDADLVFLQIGDVGLPAQEPQQLVDDRAQVQLLGRDQWKAVLEIEAHLPAEHAAGAGTGAVGFAAAVFEHVPQQVEIVLHDITGCMAQPFAGAGCAAIVGARRDSHSRNRPIATSGRLSNWPMVSQPNAR
jgi:hypothetical protein